MTYYSILLCIFLFGLTLQSCKSNSRSSDKLFIYASIDEELAKELTKAFTTETKIEVEFVRLSTGEAAARIEAEKNNPQAAVWLGGPAGGHSEVKQKGLTISYRPSTADKIPQKFRDSENYWTGFYLGVLAIAVNPTQISKAGFSAPEQWTDLLQNHWKGKIQMPNPGTSGTSYNFLTSMIAQMGEPKAFEFLKSLHKNISQYTRSGQAPVKNVAIGESLVAIGYAQDILKLIYKTNAPLQIVYPKDGTGYEVSAISMIKGVRNEMAAKKFIDWMFERNASQIIADQYIEPLITTGVSVKSESKMPASLKLIDTDIDWAGKNKTRLIETWNEKINS